MFGVACCCVCKAYFTKESELPSTSVSIQRGQIRVSGSSGSVHGSSASVGHLGQWIIRVSGSYGSVGHLGQWIIRVSGSSGFNPRGLLYKCLFSKMEVIR